MIAQTPPMGWNSWDCYGASVNEATVRANAEFMARNLKQYGWEYIVVDIQWYEPKATSHAYNSFTELEMDEYSRLIPAVNRFPSAADGRGFTSLGEYIHSFGLKFGIHIMRGVPRQAVHRNTSIKGTNVTARQIASDNSICRWNTDMYGINPDRPGAAEYYNSIFEMYASWGVDYVKVDDIANHYPVKEIELIDAAIINSGREMVLSLSPGPAPLEQAESLKTHANMWRITDDFWDKWELLYAMFERAEKWSIHSGPGHWPDADMLPIGPIRQDYNIDNMTLFTRPEQITMMTLWCMMRSPLMIGGEMTRFDDFTMSLICNGKLLKLLSDTFCAHQVYKRGEQGSEEICWYAPARDGSSYIAMFNASEIERSQKVLLQECLPDGKYTAEDVWKGTIAEVTDMLETVIEPHGAALFKLDLF